MLQSKYRDNLFCFIVHRVNHQNHKALWGWLGCHDWKRTCSHRCKIVLEYSLLIAILYQCIFGLLLDLIVVQGHLSYQLSNPFLTISFNILFLTLIFICLLHVIYLKPINIFYYNYYDLFYPIYFIIIILL